MMAGIDLGQLPELPRWAGIFVGIAIGLVGGWWKFKVDTRRVDVEEEKVKTDAADVVLSGWNTLYEAMQHQVTALTERVSTLEQQLADTRVAHADDLAALKKAHANELRHCEEEISGLRRMIAQQGISVLHALDDKAEQIDKDVGEAIGDATRRFRQQDENDEQH